MSGWVKESEKLDKSSNNDSFSRERGILLFTQFRICLGISNKNLFPSCSEFLINFFFLKLFSLINLFFNLFPTFIILFFSFSFFNYFPSIIPLFYFCPFLYSSHHLTSRRREVYSVASRIQRIRKTGI